jgi:hypothetical protein
MTRHSHENIAEKSGITPDGLGRFERCRCQRIAGFFDGMAGLSIC